METEQVLGLIVLGWLIASVLLAARLIRKGRQLTATLARRHPETWEALGRPQPGFLYSARRNKFTRLLLSREYENLDDPELSAGFEAYRKAEARLLLILLASLAVVAVLVFTISR
jgi:hypothetical protein